jgi:hypothetical protein
VERTTVVLFAGTLFLNALLLFLVQPMFARLLLPLLGGSPSVWTACMLFFQTALLAGYLYAHATVRLLGTRRQALLHVAIVFLPFLVLPISVASEAARGSATEPIAWLLKTSTIAVGLPFVVLATSAPLLQRWFSATGHAAARDPYFLYAASNTGSFVALVSYPTLLEPALSLRNQTTIWAIGYGVAALLTVACALVLRRGSRHENQQHAAIEPVTPLSHTRRLRWIALSFVPSSLMLAVTAYLSTDVAPVPLLWTVPLALYLLTFILTFGSRAGAFVTASSRALPFSLLLVVLLLVQDSSLPSFWLTVAVHLATFTLLAVLCHAALAADRPAPEHLTEFYLLLSVGGALGGIFNTLVAPYVFTGIGEYPLLLGVGCLVLGLFGRGQRSGTSLKAWITPVAAAALVAGALAGQRWALLEPAFASVIVVIAIVLCFSLSRDALRFGTAILLVVVAHASLGGAHYGRVLYAERTFFGVYRVATDTSRRLITLFHGTTNHGRQHVGSATPEPLTYYHRDSPIADVFRTRATSDTQSVGVIGLGVGSLAYYSRPGQQWWFYEIDPEVERIARDERYFGFLSACGDACRVIIGDARLTLGSHDVVHDVIVLDAFSSDAIPVHLMTREAIALYLSRLAPEGVLAFHISNRHLDLKPVLARLARDHELIVRARVDTSPNDNRTGRSGSHWVVLGRSRQALGPLWSEPAWSSPSVDAQPAWTDDFSNIWSVIHRDGGQSR